MAGDERSPRARQKRRTIMIAVAAAGVLLAVFVLLFLLVNDAWVVIHVPHAPWEPEAGWAAFEARLAAVMVVSFLLGAVCAALAYRFLGGESRKKSSRDQDRIAELESELKNVSRLLASSRDKS